MILVASVSRAIALVSRLNERGLIARQREKKGLRTVCSVVGEGMQISEVD